MACPTCSHTLGILAHDNNRYFYSCARCGTIVVNALNDHGEMVSGFPRVYVPKLVERCIVFGTLLPRLVVYQPDELLIKWASTGIAESIGSPKIGG